MFLTDSSYMANSGKQKKPEPEKKPEIDMDMIQKVYINLATSIFFFAGYYIISKWVVQWMINKFFPGSDVKAEWNILSFIKRAIV